MVSCAANSLCPESFPRHSVTQACNGHTRTGRNRLMFPHSSNCPHRGEGLHAAGENRANMPRGAETLWREYPAGVRSHPYPQGPVPSLSRNVPLSVPALESDNLA